MSTQQHPAVVFPAVRLYVSQTSDLPAPMRGKLHLHPHYELMWLARGEATFFSDFEQYPLQAGSLAFIMPGQLHTWRGDWEHFHLVVIGFHPAIFPSQGYDPHFLDKFPFFQLGACPILPAPASEVALFEMLFDTIGQRYRQFGLEQEGLLLAYLSTLLTEASRLYEATTPLPPNNAATHLTQAFRRAVERHYRQRWKISQYATHLGVTTNHLVKTVRETLGVTPGQIARERLLLEAKRQLVYTPQSVAEISHTLAFGTPTQFGNWFTNLEGLPPGQFRQQFHLA